jgi:hypothetical protein
MVRASAAWLLSSTFSTPCSAEGAGKEERQENSGQSPSVGSPNLLPVGGEDLDMYTGPARLVQAVGDCGQCVRTRITRSGINASMTPKSWHCAAE